MSSCIKALNIDSIVDEVIWLSQAGSCKSIDCQDLGVNGLHPPLYHCRVAHLRSLSQCILVCKLWSRIGVPQLWSVYTKDKNLLALIQVKPDKPGVDLQKICKESTIDTEVRYLIAL
jgi:hypothetical protein